MDAGREARPPFPDRDVTSLAMSLPTASKRTRGTRAMDPAERLREAGIVGTHFHIGPELLPRRYDVAKLAEAARSWNANQHAFGRKLFERFFPSLIHRKK